MEKKKPQIRFNGFEGEWEEKVLKEVAKLRRGLTYSPVDICNEREGIRVLRSSNIAEDIFFLSEDDVFVKPSAVNIPYIRNYDILITAANGSFRLVGKHCLVSDIQPNSCVPGGFMLCASTDSPLFLQASMSSSWYQTFIATYTLGGNGSIGNLSKTALEEQRFHIPSIPEQEKIGIFLSTLDKLIAKLEAKLDKLRKLKQALLEKMFINVNGGGYKAPQIRFKGYTDKWQVKELREVFEMPTSRISDSELQADQYISTEHILQNFEGVEPSSSMPANLSAIRFFRNDILMANIRPYLKKIWLSDRNGGASSDVIVFRITVKSDPAFLYYELTNGQFIGYVMESIQGSKMPRGNKQAMQTFKMSIAPLSEQQQIGKYFTQIDTHFSKTSTKLTKLRNIKQSLLQKMFA